MFYQTCHPKYWTAVTEISEDIYSLGLREYFHDLVKDTSLYLYIVGPKYMNKENIANCIEPHGWSRNEGKWKC